jgi:hypothetical protein
MDTSGKAFVEHWNWAADKGIMNKNTANSLRAASSQVLSIVDDWETVDITEIDVEDILRRFQNLKGRDYKPQTLNAYLRRFRQAVDYFLEYNQDPVNWKPATRTRPSQQSSKASEDRKSRKTSTSEPLQISTKPQTPEGGLVRYPYPLRENLVVYLNLPADLKVVEVKKLSVFMTTLTVDFEPEDVFSQ